jgi:hypothetical protein
VNRDSDEPEREAVQGQQVYNSQLGVPDIIVRERRESQPKRMATADDLSALFARSLRYSGASVVLILLIGFSIARGSCGG